MENSWRRVADPLTTQHQKLYQVRSGQFSQLPEGYIMFSEYFLIFTIKKTQPLDGRTLIYRCEEASKNFEPPQHTVNLKAPRRATERYLLWYSVASFLSQPNYTRVPKLTFGLPGSSFTPSSAVLYPSMTIMSPHFSSELACLCYFSSEPINFVNLLWNAFRK